MGYITNLERANIVLLYEKNKWSSNKIAKELKINVNTVLLWIKRYKEQGTIDEIKKSGRFRKTTKKEDLKTMLETLKKYSYQTILFYLKK